MQLSFLGKSYTASSHAIEVTETQETATFMGKPYFRKQFTVAQRQQPQTELTFLGRRYTH